MALLKHDAQGFLAGDPIDIGQALSIWDEIRRDVKAIRQAVGGLSSAPSSPNVVSIQRADAGKVAERLAQRAAPDRARLAVVPKGNEAMTVRVDVQQQAAQRQAAMRQVVAGGQQGTRAIATPRQRDALGRFVKSTTWQEVARADADPAIRAAQEVAQPLAAAQQPVRAAMPVATASEVLTAISVAAGAPTGVSLGAQGVASVERTRDGRGQFTKGGSGGDADRAPVTEGGFRTFFDRLSETIEGGGDAAADADPAIRAAQEVAQPLARGYQMLTGGGSRQDKRQEGWLRRIFASISGFRKDEMAAAKLAQRTLKDIADKPVDGAEGGQGFWAGLLAAIAGVGPMIVAALLALLGKIPVVGPLLAKAFGFGGAAGATGAAGAAGAAAGAAKTGGMLGAAKGALKKLPVIGALLATAGAAADVYGSESNDRLSRKEKDQNAGKAAGGLAGTLGGAWAGASAGAALGALGGPIGAAIGGVVGGVAGAFFGDQAGQVLGQTVGGWVGDLRQADIPGRISSAWASVTTTVSEHWSVATGKWDEVAKAVASAWDGVVKAFASVADGVSDAWGKFVDSANSGWDAFVGLFRSAHEGLKSLPVIGPAIRAAEDAAKKATMAAAESAKAAKDRVQAAAVDAGKVAKEKVADIKDKVVAVGYDVASGASQGYQGAAVSDGATLASRAGHVVGSGASAVAGAPAATAQWAAENTTVGKGVATAYQVAKPVAQQVSTGATQTAQAAGRAVRYGADVATETATQAARTVGGKITGKTAANKAALTAQVAAAGITDPKERAMLMAQMDHESGGFTKMEESFNYRSADRLMQVSGSARKLGRPALEVAIAKGPEAVAEAMYGGRMGNTTAGDAHKYRGRGHVQLTGKDNYAAASKDLGLDLLANPDAAATPEVAAKIATWYWQKNKLGAAAKKGDVRAVTQRINGGTNGLSDRQEKYDQYLAAATQDGDLAAAPVGAKVDVAAMGAPVGGTGKASGQPLATLAQPATAPTDPKKAAVAQAEQGPSLVASGTVSFRDDPTQGGRLAYKDIGDGQFSVSDSVTGITELATDEQANAHRRSQTKAYRDALAAANNPEVYKPTNSPGPVGPASSTASVASAASTTVASKVASAAAHVPAATVQAAALSSALAAPVQTAFAPAPMVPSFAPPPVVAKAPDVVNPLGTGTESRKPIAVRLPPGDVGQDVRDRRIAHIVTGGIGA